MNKLIFLVITLQVTVSERTFYPITTHTIEVCKDWDEDEIQKEIDRYSLEVAKTYTDNLDSDEYHDMIKPDNKTTEIFYFNGSELSTEVFTVNRVTKGNYEVLTKYLI